jgi:hypothetical protein
MRVRILFVAALCGFGVYVILTVVNGSGKAHSQQSHQNHNISANQDQSQKLPPLLVDGAINPDGIPDKTAYELLFNSVLAPPEEGDIKKKNADALAARTKLDANGIFFLRQAAQTAQDKIRKLDITARAIKDKVWPKPSAQDIAELNELQKQKEAIIEETIRSLPARIGEEKSQILAEHVRLLKRKMKVYTDLPIEMYQHK